MHGTCPWLGLHFLPASYPHGMWWISISTLIYPWNLTPCRYSANIICKSFFHIIDFRFSVSEDQQVWQHRFHQEYKLNPLSWLGCSLPGFIECSLFYVLRSGITFNLKYPSLFPISFFCLMQFFQFLMRCLYNRRDGYLSVTVKKGSLFFSGRSWNLEVASWLEFCLYL